MRRIRRRKEQHPSGGWGHGHRMVGAPPKAMRSWALAQGCELWDPTASSGRSSTSLIQEGQTPLREGSWPWAPQCRRRTCRDGGASKVRTSGADRLRARWLPPPPGAASTSWLNGHRTHNTVSISFQTHARLIGDRKRLHPAATSWVQGHGVGARLGTTSWRWRRTTSGSHNFVNVFL